MVGMWEDSIASNRSALEIQPDYYHATDFMVYAHLQLAQDARAKALVDQIVAVPKQEYPNIAGFTAVAAVPARYVLERGDWAGAAALPVVSTGRQQADSLVRFTRGLGMARSGNLAGAKQEIQAMQELRTALEKSNQSYWADRTEEQMLAVSAWVALADGPSDQALKLMRAAADGEDGSVKHVAMENRLYPMRELLGELLLQQGQASAALREFEASLKENPNRYRSLYGAARAAEVAGDRPKAAGYYEKLVALTGKADTARPEIARGHEVDGRIHAAAARELHHLSGQLAAADVDQRVGVAVLRGRELVVGDVGGQHPPARELGHLHGVDADSTARAHDQHEIAGANARFFPARVIRSRDRVGGDRGVDVADALWNRHDVPGRERHVFRVGAVARHAHVAGRSRTQGLAPAPAEVTDATGQIEVTGDTIADLDVSNLGAELDDLAGHLVAGDPRKRRHASGDPGHDHDGEPDTRRADAE